MSRRHWSRRIAVSWRSKGGGEGEEGEGEGGDGSHAGTANGFGESASDHAVILRIQGRRHPALPSVRIPN